jgi:hypothetical protein
MAINVQVMCINKRNRTNPHERIENIGGTNADGARWKLTEAQAITGIHADKWRFFVSVGGAIVWVTVALHEGREYLKTEPDKTLKDNLLSLPECPQ